MNTRRSFIRQAIGFSGALSVSPILAQAMAEDIADALRSLNLLSPVEAASDEELWKRVSQAFTVSPAMLELNNGGVSPQPRIVQEAVDRFYHFSNQGPSYYMWRELDRGREPLRKKLAGLAGVSEEEVAINRNTTEALGTVTYGLTLHKGDEILMSRQDYPNMIQAWKQRELREGIKINWLDFTLPLEDEEYVVKTYVDATTPQTRVWHITHMMNWTGQIMPVKRLCEEARKRNIITIVDGAQSFAHLEFNIADFAPDYFGTSLHKWLCAPFGTGMLYVKRENVEELWPLFPTEKPQENDIRKFELLGTRSFALEQAIGQAIDFHETIGSRRKEERLRYLKNYWCDKLKTHPRIKLNTSLKPEFACGLGNFSLEGIEPAALVFRLFDEYKIHTSPGVWENISGVRITPHVYTSTRDLDRFVEAVLKIANG